MTVILVDLADDQHDLQINWWNWRPILSFLREGGLIGEEQFERMGANGCGGRLTAEEAVNVAEFLKLQILPLLRENERMHADGQVTPLPEAPRPITSTDSYELYAAQESCIQSFVAFCETCQGFDVL